MRYVVATIAVAGILLLAAACGQGGPFDPADEPEVHNDTNAFSWQAVGMDNVSDVRNYTWQTTGSWAVVRHLPDFTGGNALLRIWDAAGTPVYSRDLDKFGTYATLAGQAGAWTIEVRLSGASGAVGFTVGSE